MTTNDKLADRLEKVRSAAEAAWKAAGPDALSILADTERVLKRTVRRAETLDQPWERVEIKQQRGPTLEFTGKLLFETKFETASHDPMRVEFEIWETQGGAMVAVSATEPAQRAGIEIVNATVVPLGDTQAMRCAVMDHFDWHDRARNMARKLGWALRQEVE